MRVLLKLFNPVRQAAVAFFRHDLALRKDPAGLQIVLEARTVAPASSKKPKVDSRTELAARKEKQDLAVILEQLGELLTAVPETRSALRHLVFVEHALQKKGVRALHRLPLDVLQKALEQLEGLVVNWSPVGLASLRSKMAVAVIDREHMDPETEADAYRTAAVMDTPPIETDQPEVSTLSEDDALAAAYAALGNMVPSGELEFQGELGSKSARAVGPTLPRVMETAGNIELRELQN